MARKGLKSTRSFLGISSRMWAVALLVSLGLIKSSDIIEPLWGLRYKSTQRLWVSLSTCRNWTYGCLLNEKWPTPLGICSVLPSFNGSEFGEIPGKMSIFTGGVIIPPKDWKENSHELSPFVEKMKRKIAESLWVWLKEHLGWRWEPHFEPFLLGLVIWLVYSSENHVFHPQTVGNFLLGSLTEGLNEIILNKVFDKNYNRTYQVVLNLPNAVPL